MGIPDPSKTPCPECIARNDGVVRNAGPYPGGTCRKCYDTKRATKITIGKGVPQDLADRVKAAQASGDWKALADSLNSIVQGIANGSITASAAQASLIKHILDRAYGRVSKTQEDKQGPLGIVILPTIGRDSDTQVCAKCLEYHRNHLT